MNVLAERVQRQMSSTETYRTFPVKYTYKHLPCIIINLQKHTSWSVSLKVFNFIKLMVKAKLHIIKNELMKRTLY